MSMVFSLAQKKVGLQIIGVGPPTDAPENDIVADALAADGTSLARFRECRVNFVRRLTPSMIFHTTAGRYGSA
jgi:hypothetical protein